MLISSLACIGLFIGFVFYDISEAKADFVMIPNKTIRFTNREFGLYWQFVCFYCYLIVSR